MVRIQRVDIVAPLVDKPLIRRRLENITVSDGLGVVCAERVARHDVRLLVVVVCATVRLRLVGLPGLVLVDDRLVEVQPSHRRVDWALTLSAQFQRLVANLRPPHRRRIPRKTVTTSMIRLRMLTAVNFDSYLTAILPRYDLRPTYSYVACCTEAYINI